MAIFFIAKITFGNNFFLLVKKSNYWPKKKPMLTAPPMKSFGTEHARLPQGYL